MEVGQERACPSIAKMTPLVEVQNLHISYTARTGQQSAALVGASFAINPGETLGVLGESGSGKSTLAAALLRMLPANGNVRHGAVHFEGQDLLKAGSHGLELRSSRQSLTFRFVPKRQCRDPYGKGNRGHSHGSPDRMEMGDARSH
jgi:ABC-type glutathione transport system ATPase component